jgi:hypothetical protein
MVNNSGDFGIAAQTFVEMDTTLHILANSNQQVIMMTQVQILRETTHTTL